MTVTNAVQEEARLAVLRGLRIMDADAEPEFDDIALLASEICRAPIAMVSLIDDDRQWFKARVGVDYSEGCRDNAFCAHALDQPDVLEVPDARADRASPAIRWSSVSPTSSSTRGHRSGWRACSATRTA